MPLVRGIPGMDFFSRLRRHVRLVRHARSADSSPPFLVLFINSICNMKCEHCFYWQSLNSRDDLTREELFALSDSLGRIENLNLSGGEPFLRRDFSEICRRFIRRNGVREIYVPTNGFYTERTVDRVKETLEEPSLRLFAVELSLDGTAEFHDKFRGLEGSFERALETYDALASLQEQDPRLRIHCISTATDTNVEEIRKLTHLLFERCPQMDHHNLAMIRGDRKNPALKGPQLDAYVQLYRELRELWMPREKGRYGAQVEPLLQCIKVETAASERQVVPCRAGRLTAVVYANGDVSVCEYHKPLGNLRQHSFQEIWHSDAARRLRASIDRRECYCTTETFLWPSIVYQPVPLLRSMLKTRRWLRSG